MNDADGSRAALLRILGSLLMAVTLVVAACDTSTPLAPTTPTCSASQGNWCAWDIGRSMWISAVPDASIGHSMDVVMYAAQDYGDITQQGVFTTFMRDAKDMVVNGFYHSNAIWVNKTLFRFWLSTLPGATVTIPADPDAICQLNTKSVPNSPTWADSVLVLHQGTCRDDSPDHFSTVTAGSVGVAVHEFAHSSPFHLPDEYGYPTYDGGYWTAAPEEYISVNGDLCNQDPNNAAWRSSQGCGHWTPKTDVPGYPAGSLVWDSEYTQNNIMAQSTPFTTLQFGPANWAIMQPILANLAPSGVAVNTPTVFAPDMWPGP